MPKIPFFSKHVKVNTISFWSLLCGALVFIITCSASAAEGDVLAKKGPEIDMAFYGLQGNIYYVSESGDDNNNGRQENLPFKTLQHASDLAQPGDIIYVMNGLYQNVKDEDILGIRRSGTKYKWIMYAALPGHNPKLKVKAGDAISIHGAEYLIIDGFEIEGNNHDVTLEYALAEQNNLSNKLTNSSGVSIHPDWNTTNYPHHVIVRNCHIYNFSGGGIASNTVDYNVIENNTVHHNGYYAPWAMSGISLYRNWNFDNNEGYKMIIRNNISYANRNYVPFFYSHTDPEQRTITDGNGIIVDTNHESRKAVNGVETSTPYIGRTLIENNVSYLNGGKAINIYKSDHIDVINNTTYQNSQTNRSIGEITLGKADDINLYNNIVYPKLDDHSINMWATGSSITIDYNLIYNTNKNFFPRANNLIELDPLFVNIDPISGQYNFRLKPDSPAIDNGNNQFASIIDSDGITRPVNKEYDIGAFEFTGQNTETSKNIQQDQSRNTKTTTKTVSLAIKISTSNDDVEEKASGKVIIGSGDLDLVRSGSDQTIGMRFSAVSIPKGAIITNASIQFTAADIASKPTNLIINGKAEDNASVFKKVAFSVSSAPTTSASVLWSPQAWLKTNESGIKQRTPNIASVIQEIINRPGWNEFNALSIIISGTGKREAVSYDGSSDAAPILYVEYVTNVVDVVEKIANSAPRLSIQEPIEGLKATVGDKINFKGTSEDDNDGDLSSNVKWTSNLDGYLGKGRSVFVILSQGIHLITASVNDSAGLSTSKTIQVTIDPKVVKADPVQASLEIQISSSNDDVEEKASGKVIIGSGDLDLVRSGGNQTIGMRFTTVSIPKGAVITNAYIQFTAKSTGSKKTKLVIKGTAEDDASVFNRVAFNVSSAPTTSSSVSWSPRAWSKRNESGLKQRTPNLASIIQEIIDRPGWSQDNALALIISGRGKREAVSYDGNPDAAPRLFVKYVTN